MTLPPPGVQSPPLQRTAPASDARRGRVHIIHRVNTRSNWFGEMRFNKAAIPALVLLVAMLIPCGVYAWLWATSPWIGCYDEILVGVDEDSASDEAIAVAFRSQPRVVYNPVFVRLGNSSEERVIGFMVTYALISQFTGTELPFSLDELCDELNIEFVEYVRDRSD